MHSQDILKFIKLIFNEYKVVGMGRAETIIRTNQLVGYQSTSRRQYYEIG